MFPMPNGNFLALVFDERTIEIDGQPQEVEGERIVEFDRETKEVVWDWSTWDHYSLEDQPPPHLDHDHWIHANAVVYNERDNSVYISSRSLSRITRIDYDTREVVYNMGKAMPSGDVDFGDGLFHAQHAPELLRNGNMLLHDNGTCCDRERFISRAIELEFDNPHDPTSASVAWEYVLPTFAPIIGDVDRMPNGNTLIASGGVFGPGRVIEVTRKGELAWKLEVEDPYFFYRAERIPELVVRSKGARLAALLEAVGQTARCRSKN
jgi:arylsulfate sulfotransferase